VPKVGTVQSSSEQFASNAVMPSEGHNFFLGTGPALPAGRELRVTLSGLPTRSHAGRWLAILMAVLVLGAGAWSAFAGRRPTADETRRAELEARRKRLLADLAGIERQRRDAGDSERLLARRQDLMAQIERVYGELDQHGAPTGLA
jgi:hypothetical protein